MRIYFKGVVLALALLMLMVMVQRHFRSQRHVLGEDHLTKGRAMDFSRSRGRLKGTSQERMEQDGRLETPSSDQPKARKAAGKQGKLKKNKLTTKGQESQEDNNPFSTSLSQVQTEPRGSDSLQVGPQDPLVLNDHDTNTVKKNTGVKLDAIIGTYDSEMKNDVIDDAQGSSSKMDVIGDKLGSVSKHGVIDDTHGSGFKNDASNGSQGSQIKFDATQKSQSASLEAQGIAEVKSASVGETLLQVAQLQSQNEKGQMDIRTVDPLSATEPLVMRQQEELEQQRFGFQPWRGRPKPPEKLLDPSQSWLTDMQYPEWYADSVKRSRVYGREKERVGEAPLFEGPCPDAAKAKAKFQAEKTKTYTYITPGPFIANSKNPCWYEDQKRKRLMRCVPYFYVAGVAKCGTTDLYKRIRYHPDIMEGELKEYHWWDRLRYGAPMELKFTKDSEKNDHPLPLSEYSRIITGKEIENLKTDLRAHNHSDRICGDGSPSYLWDPGQWSKFEGNEGCSEPRIVVGSFIYHANPRSKILLIFRHPTQRLYSRFLSRVARYAPFKGATPHTFHDLVVKGVACYKKCFQEHSIRECAYNDTLYDEAVIRLVEGMYSVFVEDWLRIFPREQILVMRNEDYSEDIEGHILNVFDFLNVAKLGRSEMRPVLTHVSTNIGQNYDKVGPMLPETIAILNEFYKPFVLRLHEMLEDDRFLWKDIAVT